MKTRADRAGRYGVGSIAAFALAIAAAQPAGDSDATARDLAHCAAYFFDATQAKPMAEYEALHNAGEAAFNRAARVLGRTTVDRLIGDAAAEITATMGNDWQNFGRVEARFDARCNELLDMKPE